MMTLWLTTASQKSAPITPLYHLGLLIMTSYDFEYEDADDDAEVGDVDVENKYFSAKQMKIEEPEAAIEEFLGVPALEDGKTEMCALRRRAIKISTY